MTWTEHIPPTQRTEDCECGKLHLNQDYLCLDIICPACDGVYVIHEEAADHA